MLLLQRCRHTACAAQLRDQSRVTGHHLWHQTVCACLSSCYMVATTAVPVIAQSPTSLYEM
jgi:hypothetical protein